MTRGSGASTSELSTPRVTRKYSDSFSDRPSALLGSTGRRLVSNAPLWS